MPVNTGKRVTEDTTRRTPYNVAPTFRDPAPPATGVLPTAGQYPSGVPPMGGTFDENPNWVNVPAAPPPPPPAAAPDPYAMGAGDSGIGGIMDNGAGPMMPTAPAPGVSPSSPSYDDMLSKYLGEVFGSGRSFDPTAQKITGQRDDSLMQMAEKLASRGMGNSGLAASGASDIYRGAGQDSASSYQDWRSGGIQEMKGALAPFIEEANAEKLMNLSTEQKKEILNAQLEMTMKQLFGNDYDPAMGSADFDLFATMAGKGEPNEEMQAAIENWIRKNPWMAQFMDKSDNYDRGGYSPF